MKKENLDSRLLAVEIIKNICLNKGSLTTQLARLSNKANLDNLALIKEVCFGVSRYYPRLNSIALYMLDKPLAEKDLDVYVVILIGLYQLDYMSTPSHAAINEAVEDTKKLDKQWAAKLVNALLRRYQRESDKIREVLKDTPSVADSHPKWLTKRFKNHWPLQYDQIIAANNARAPMCLRVNLSHVSRETELNTLKKAGIESHYGDASETALYLKTPMPVHEIPNFFNGDISVQDEAAQLSAHILKPQPQDKVLDACAAPGGKTGHLLEYAKNIDLTAIELEDWRLERIKENLERLSLSAKLICADAGELESWWDGKPFDKILLDAPCSATGVIRRNPDIKINRKPADIEALVSIQKNLLGKVWQTLKEEGQLLYATCSLMQEENELQIQDFLEQHDDAEEVIIEASWGEKVSFGRQLFPTKNSHDGFYYCLLRKKKIS